MQQPGLLEQPAKATEDALESECESQAKNSRERERESGREGERETTTTQKLENHFQLQ